MVMLNFFPSVYFVYKKQAFRKYLSEIPSECQTGLDPDQVGRFVGPDLGPICLKRL